MQEEPRISRGATRKKDATVAQLIDQGIAHKGFAFIDVLQICASFFNMTDYYQSRVYDLAGHDTADFEKACAKARESDYNRDAPIALGVSTSWPSPPSTTATRPGISR